MPRWYGIAPSNLPCLPYSMPCYLRVTLHVLLLVTLPACYPPHVLTRNLPGLPSLPRYPPRLYATVVSHDGNITWLVSAISLCYLSFITLPATFASCVIRIVHHILTTLPACYLPVTHHVLTRYLHITCQVCIFCHVTRHVCMAS